MPERIAGLVLAGGKSRRFGGNNKAFVTLGGKPLIEYALAALSGTNLIAISANEDASVLERFGLPILADAFVDAGPLAGIHAGLAWAARASADWLATVPVDTPFLPRGLAHELHAQSAGAEAVVATSGPDMSPVCALWSVALEGRAAAAIERGTRKMSDFLATTRWRAHEFALTEPHPLFNVNTPESLAEAERALRR